MNKNLAQITSQLAGIWTQLGLNQRISVIIATIALVAGLGGVAYWSSRPDYTLLYGKLDEGEASKVVAALDESKVPYQVRGAGSIYVPADKVYQVRMQMAGKGIPRGEGVGFEIFDKASFGLSDFVQRANYARAIEGELARTISQLDQVESARVLIVMPENRLLTDSMRKPTASVFVRVKGNGQLSPSAINSIQFLVANSVEGLQANNVSVVDNQGNVLSSNQENDSVAGMSGNQLTARRNFEQYLTKKAEGMLDEVLGPGQAVVRVAVDFNWDTLTKTEEKYDPDGQVARNTTINEETTDTDAATTAASGSPGIASNGVPGETNTTTTASAAPVNSNHSHKKINTSTYEINKMTTSTIAAAGGVKRISSAVFIAQRFDGTGTDRKAVPRTPDELEKLRNIVKSALGIVETGDPTRKDELTLEEIPFNDQTATVITQQLDQQTKRQFWMDLGQKLIYPAMAVGMIFMFWRLLKNTKADDIPIGVPLGSGRANAVVGKNGAAPPGLVTVDVLNQLIRENPSNMTQAVRTWMTRSSNTTKVNS